MFKEERSADAVRKDLSKLSKKIESDLRPVFSSRKIIDDNKGVEALFTNFHVICAIQIISYTHPDTSFNISPNMKIVYW